MRIEFNCVITVLDSLHVQLLVNANIYDYYRFTTQPALYKLQGLMILFTDSVKQSQSAPLALG